MGLSRPENSVPEPREGGYNIGAPFMSEHSIRIVPELWPVVSALTVFHSTKKLLDKV